MSRTLPVAREAFVAAMKRETTGTELARLVAVLDALIKWSVGRPQTLTFHADASPVGVIAFECVPTKTILWSARVTRGDAPKLEIYPPTGRSLTAESRAKVKEILNAHTRDLLEEKDRLRIGFGALKNNAALVAVTGLLGELLETHGRPMSVVS
jgi:hypothetical protein